MAKEKDRRVCCKPLEKLRLGNVEVVVWPFSGRGGAPSRRYSLTRYVVNYEKRAMTWVNLHGLSSRDLQDLRRLIGDALERELAAGGEA